MPIDMTTVKKITHDVEVPLYKRTFYFGHSNIVYKNTTTPCLVAVTIYSQTQVAWDSSITTAGIEFFNYLVSLGYTKNYSGSGYYIILAVDNPYEFEYIDGSNNRCPVTTVQARYYSPYLGIWFSVPGATSTSPTSDISISCTDWTLVGNVSYDFYVKRYINATAGSYTQLIITKSITTGDEYINNYVINGVAYPNVTITSSSGTSYTLSDNNTYTVGEYPIDTFVTPVQKEVIKIEDSNGGILWRKRNGKYTVTLTRTNVYSLTVPSEETIKSQISTETGIPASNITITKRTYSIYVYKVSGGSSNNIYILLNNGTTRDETNNKMYMGTSIGNGIHFVTFEYNNNSITTIRGYQGNTYSYSSLTSNFSSNYNYFSPNYTHTVKVEYEF